MRSALVTVLGLVRNPCVYKDFRDELMPCSPSRIFRSLYSMPFVTSADLGLSLMSRAKFGSATNRSSAQAETCSTPGSTTSGGRPSICATRGSLLPRVGVQRHAGLSHRDAERFQSVLSSCSIRVAASTGSSCSQTRTTRQPWSASSAVVCSSRATLAASLFAHQAELFLDGMECTGHRCQKHPSTKMARRCRGNAMSIVLRALPGTLIPMRNRLPRRCSSLRSASSGAVSARRCELILRRTSSVAGAGPTSSVAMVANYDTDHPIPPPRAVGAARHTPGVVPLRDALTATPYKHSGVSVGLARSTDIGNRRAQK